MGVPLPTIDSIGNTIDIEFHHRLTESKEREAIVDTEFNGELGPDHTHQVIRKWQVIYPGAKDHTLGLEALK
jgi:hypothetical protein